MLLSGSYKNFIKYKKYTNEKRNILLLRRFNKKDGIFYSKDFLLWISIRKR